MANSWQIHGFTQAIAARCSHLTRERLFIKQFIQIWLFGCCPGGSARCRIRPKIESWKFTNIFKNSFWANFLAVFWGGWQMIICGPTGECCPNRRASGQEKTRKKTAPPLWFWFNNLAVSLLATHLMWLLFESFFVKTFGWTPFLWI